MKLGENTVLAGHIGSKAILRSYLGSELVFAAEQSTPEGAWFNEQGDPYQDEFGAPVTLGYPLT